MILRRHASPPDRPARWPAPLRAWAACTDGSMTVFALLIFFAMFLVGGVAVDMMRVEHERVRIQGAADRAVLAATMQRQNSSGATPDQIVTAYMAAEGLADFVQTPITVYQVGGARSVTVDVRARMPTSFMQLLGVNDLVIRTPSGATEALGRIEFVEVVLVLDVSGSMAQFGRIEALRSSVIDFAEMLFAATEPGQLGLTIVPYSTEVILPAPVLTALNPASPTNILLPGSPSFCIDFDDWPNVRNRINGTMHNTGQVAGLVGSPWRRRNCDMRSNTTFRQPETRVYLSSLQQVRDYVATLGPVWGTSIDLGVVTGALFFDPSLRPTIQTMIENGTVHQNFSGRPFAWDRPGVVRALVLMTDGDNCCFHPNHAATRHPNIDIQDAFTVAACQGLRDRNVAIYTIAFEAPPGGTEMMRACASSPNHFFVANADGLIDVFRGIGTHLQHQALRLTQ